MTALMAETAAPSVADARCAAAPLLAAGAEEVWLFGSVARGEATVRSDIDMLALFADIDYSERLTLRRQLETAAAEAVGGRWPVQVFVTDRPEWKARCEQVRSSFEHRISCLEMILVADSAIRGRVEWTKPMERPMSDLAEAWSRFDDEILEELSALEKFTVAGHREWDPYDRVGDPDGERRGRLVRTCTHAAMVVEKVIKNLALWHSDPPPDSRELRAAGHDIAAGLMLLPTSVRFEVEDWLNAAGVNQQVMSSWRAAATYPDHKSLMRDIAEREAEGHVIAALETAAVLHSDLATASDATNVTFRAISLKWREYSTFIGGQDIFTGRETQRPYRERVSELTGRETLLDDGSKRALRLDSPDTTDI